MADMEIIDTNSDGDVNPDQGFSSWCLGAGVVAR